MRARFEKSLSDLGRSLSGSVVGPADAEYDAARRSFNAFVDRRPAVIVRCVGTNDVTTAFDFARTHELEVAVRGGGHNPAGHCVLDDGLVIDLSAMAPSTLTPTRESLMPTAARPGSISTPRLKPSDWSRQEASSAPPGCAGLRSAVASAI